jgi:hypothetical protein
MCGKFWPESRKGRDFLEYVAVDGRVLLKLIIDK